MPWFSQVKNHERKMKKDMKKHPFKSGKKMSRDPGIPNLHPYKTQLMAKVSTSCRLAPRNLRICLRRVAQQINNTMKRVKEAEAAHSRRANVMVSAVSQRFLVSACCF